MKIKVNYPTKEKIYIKPGQFRYVYKEIEITPVRVTRWACGPNRYYYAVQFLDPGDAVFVNNGIVEWPLNRKKNPKFNPKKLNFEGNVCNCNQ